MKRNTFPIRTSAVRSAKLSNLFPYSTERIPQRRVVGRGIAIASSAGAITARITARRTATSETLGSRHGELGIRKQLRKTISALALNRNTGSQSKTWRSCERASKGNAPFASDRRSVCLWITAIQRDTFGPCFVRRATRSSVGTRRKQTQSCAFKTMLRVTQNNQPCHADVLLEIANAVPLQDRAEDR